MRRWIMAGLVAASAFGGAACAQQRSLNPGLPGAVRQWPVSGVWKVIMFRASNGGLMCGMVTTWDDTTRGEEYIWGVMEYSSIMFLILGDKNTTAVAGRSISVAVDQSFVGEFLLTSRQQWNRTDQIMARIVEADKARFLRLFSTGKTIVFITAVARYSASLQGAPQAARNFEQCNAEAGALSGQRLP